MWIPKFFTRKLDEYKLKTIETANITFDTLFRAGLVLAFLFLIVWVSVFLYVVFYYTYVPSIEHVKSVNLQFDACEQWETISEKGVCSFLKSHVELTKGNQLFMLGQPYKITLVLEVPESEPNKSIGMFMVCAQLMDKKSVVVSMSCRSAMLRYRSPLVHTLTALALAPFYVFKLLEEKQIVEVELYSGFEDDQNNPVTDIVIELKSPKVEVYSSRIQIDAHLSGLRYIMFHWPTTTAAVGISFNLCVMLFIAIISWWQLFGSNKETGHELLYKKFKEKLSPVFMGKKKFSGFRVEEEGGKILTLTSSSEESEPEKLFIDLKQVATSSEA